MSNNMHLAATPYTGFDWHDLGKEKKELGSY